MPIVARKRLAVALAILTVMPSAFCSSEAAAAAQTRLQLAEAFARKDTQAISPLISDAWSGLRFCSSWGDSMWKQASLALREAKVVSQDGDQILYATHWPHSPEAQKPRTIVFRLTDSGWKLDLNSFLGPFPQF